MQRHKMVWNENETMIYGVYQCVECSEILSQPSIKIVLRNEPSEFLSVPLIPSVLQHMVHLLIWERLFILIWKLKVDNFTKWLKGWIKLQQFKVINQYKLHTVLIYNRIRCLTTVVSAPWWILRSNLHTGLSIWWHLIWHVNLSIWLWH